MTKSALFLFPLLLISSSLGAEESVFGMITDMEGSPKVVRRLKSIEVQKGDELHLKDRVRTKVGEHMEINTRFGDTVRVAPRTSLVLRDSSNGRDSGKKYIHMELLGGVIRSKVTPLKGEETFIVKTPVSVAGVRGTDFLQNADGTTTVFEGKVAVQAILEHGSLSEPTFVHEHQHVSIQANRKVSTPQRLSRIQVMTQDSKHAIKNAAEHTTHQNRDRGDHALKVPPKKDKKGKKEEKDISEKDKDHKGPSDGKHENAPQDTPGTGGQQNAEAHTTAEQPSSLSEVAQALSKDLDLGGSQSLVQGFLPGESSGIDANPSNQSDPLGTEIADDVNKEVIQDIQDETTKQLYQLQFELQHRD